VVPLHTPDRHLICLSIITGQDETLPKWAGWVAHRVLQTIPHSLTLTASQEVLKQKFLQVGRTRNLPAALRHYPLKLTRMYVVAAYILVVVVVVLRTYLEKLKERDWLDQVAKVWCMFEEKHASKFGVDDVWVTT